MLCEPWLCVSLHWPLSLEESCPAQGWQCCWEIDEHAGLWLGGTLQRRSWLRENSSSKDKYCWLSHLCNLIYCFMNYDGHVQCWNVYVCFRCMLINYASRMMDCILVCFMHLSVHSVNLVLISALMTVHVHGAVCLDVLVFGRILFTGRRDGDVTEWYQSSCCSMGLNGPPGCSDRSRISFCPAEIRIGWQQTSKICLSVDSQKS